MEVEAINEWNAAIEDAESKRLTDPATMDVMKPRRPLNTATTPSHDNVPLTAAQSRIARWFEVAIQLEEQQYV